MEKMRCWFPEYNYLWPHLNRRTDWRKWQKTGVSDKLVWISYLLMKAVFFCLLRVEFFLLQFSFFHPASQWKITSSTKKRIKRIIFFDVDDTLVGPGLGKLSKLKKEIIRCQKNGDVFGLNTNRPWTESEGAYSSLGLNGPIICEGGSYFKLSAQAKAKNLPFAEKRLKNKIIKFIIKKYGKRKTSVVVSDDKRILFDKNIYQLVFITASRQFSASIYARKFGHNNRRLLASLTGEIKRYFPDYVVSLSTINNKITIDNPRINKFAAMSHLAKKYFIGYRIFMISNNENIATSWPNTSFCATMNGSQHYKNKCLYVAEKSGEEGLIQIINNCL